MQRCIIIDTSPLIRKVTGAILGSLGYEVVEATTGQAGLAQFKLCAAQLVIVDAHPPDMDALDVLRAIRDSGKANVRILYCTTEFDIIQLQRAHAAGAHDVLIKPFDRANLAAKLQSLPAVNEGSERGNFYTRLSRSELARNG